MRESIGLSGGLLVVSRAVGGLAFYDLDGRLLSRTALVTESGDVPRLAGVALDGDKRVWCCDPDAGAVRAFTAFGREVARLVDPDRAAAGPERSAPRAGSATERDAVGRLGRPWAVAVRGDSDGLELAVASRGTRRHALHLFDEGGRLLRSLRPRGDSHGHFEGLEGVALDGRLLYAVEGNGRVSVYRDLEHHFDFRVEARHGVEPQLRAVAPAGGGRIAVVGENVGLVLFDATGRPIGNPIAASHRPPDELGGEFAADESGAVASDGTLDHPTDLVIERGRPDARRRVVVADRDGARIQVFSLAGECYGAIDEGWSE
ncbi:hypothetical protein Pla163_16180 [Planctomycetes bacterium Pla163]|uniref:NHL repeat protein n=1 Tax=Rohdeia mirabilis TaxID=2528008 RepID=A0A518CZ48_9BACT|nr:hypothetical protein Pla163_16180 [Planctomycetes bacterium Pla163]